MMMHLSLMRLLKLIDDAELESSTKPNKRRTELVDLVPRWLKTWDGVERFVLFASVLRRATA